MMPESRVAPPVSAAEAERIAKELYLQDSDVEQFPGEYDDNFHLAGGEGREFVLKIMHPAREESFVDMQCRALLHLAERLPQLLLPRVQPAASGELYCRTVSKTEANAWFGCLRFCRAPCWPSLCLTPLAF